MTQSEFLEKAKRLNSERTPGNWFVEGYRRWVCPSTHEARDLPILQSDKSVFDLAFIVDGYTCTKPNSDFIANAPAVYDAYIALAEHHRETVRCMSVVLQDVANIVGVKEGDAEGLVDAVNEQSEQVASINVKMLECAELYSQRGEKIVEQRELVRELVEALKWHHEGHEAPELYKDHPMYKKSEEALKKAEGAL